MITSSHPEVEKIFAQLRVVAEAVTHLDGMFRPMRFPLASHTEEYLSIDSWIGRLSDDLKWMRQRLQ